MGAVAFTLLETFESVGPCCSCGVTIVLPQHFANKRRESHKDFYCPNGHAQHFPAKSELEKARELLETERRWREQERGRHQREEARLKSAATAAKGQLTKLKNRVTNGVCPCCNRTFRNLQKHMATVHPERVEKGRDV